MPVRHSNPYRDPPPMSKPHASSVESNELYRTVAVTIANFVSYSTWTLMNKMQFKRYDLQCPIFLAAYQMLFVGAVSWAYLAWAGRAKKPEGTVLRRILPLGLVRSADIGLGNAALRLITVALQQIIKSTIPIYVCVLNVVVLRKAVSTRVWLTLVPIIGGVALASWGELSGVAVGVFMAILSCVARAGKAIINDMLLHANTETDRLDTMQIMSFESPISGCILTVVALVLESSTLAEWLRNEESSVAAVLMYNSCCGVLMLVNQWSYISIIKYTSSVTCQVLMNLKMITLIGVSCVMFGTRLDNVHIFGMFVATVGCTLYAYVKNQDALAKAAAAVAEDTLQSPSNADNGALLTSPPARLSETVHIRA
eukprot:TRINITY_DN23044_c0_g1_i1.p1 TRINITY_DN23044_c0_g1~~TRINITY_DN23044_c0_g1_i1.p1  ORF type:complete len:369 (+),score=113.19 TRINITY_DN23044_c0_g1_i1:66-1172(+)